MWKWSLSISLHHLQSQVLAPSNRLLLLLTVENLPPQLNLAISHNGSRMFLHPFQTPNSLHMVKCSILLKILRNNQKSRQQPAKLVTGEIPLTIAPDQYLQEARDHGVANPSHAITLSSVILVIIIGMNLLYQPQAITTKATVSQALQMPANYALKESTLNPQETAFFTSNQAQANKYHLTLPIDGKPVRVAMVLVWSRAWKTHHVPENCYLSQGFSIDAQGVWQLPEHTLRYLQLNQPSTDTTGAPKTATYWFQSDNHTTPDYSARVIDNLFHPGRNWVMASILFDQTVTPEQITPFIHTLKQAIGDQFHEAQ